MDVAYDSYDRFGWSGVVRADAAGRLTSDPLEWFLAMPRQTVKQRAGIEIYRVESPLGAMFVRHDWAPKRRWYRSWRAMHSLRVQRQMLAAGIATANPVLALRRRADGRDEELFVAEEVRGTAVLRAANETIRLERLTRIAQAAAELHRHGFVHGDMLLGNLLMDPSGRVYFLDNERTRKLPWPVFHSRRRRNIYQCVSRMMMTQPFRRIARFLDAYYEAYGLSRRAARAEQLAVIRDARVRRQHMGGRQRGVPDLGIEPPDATADMVSTRGT